MPWEQTDDGSAYWPGSSWRTARPADVRMDASRLEDLSSKITSHRYPSVNGLVVVRNGYVVLEQYANGSSEAEIHQLQSVTKSITSLLIGIAIDKGIISGVDARALDFFPEYPDFKNVDARKRAVTLKSLLTMQSGIDFYEDPYPGSPLEQLNNSHDDWLRIIFDQPMNAAPFERWQYNSGGVIALGGVIYNTAHISAEQFARENLFEPLGISTWYWFNGNPNRLPHMGGGLVLRAKDLARIGYLVLRKGKWGDRQIVSEKWLAESTMHHVKNPRTFGSHPLDYGYLWWLLPVDNKSSSSWNDDIITASGANGQWLFIIPKYDVVVAVTSNGAFLDPADFLYSSILPAIN